MQYQEISGMCRRKLESTVARIYSTWDSDYEFECFDNAAIQPKNLWYEKKDDPVPEYIEECMYEKENFCQHDKKHKKYAYTVSNV